MMDKWIVPVGIVVWFLLFLLVYHVGDKILESSRKSAIKKWGMEDQDYEHEKWMFRFYVIAFFVGIPVLLAIVLFQELS